VHLWRSPDLLAGFEEGNEYEKEGKERARERERASRGKKGLGGEGK